MTYPFRPHTGSIPQMHADICTGGDFHPSCTSRVSPDDPDKELCQACLEVCIAQLDQALIDVLEERMRYRKAVTS